MLTEVTTNYPHHRYCDMLQKWNLWQSLQNRELDLKYLNKPTDLLANYIIRNVTRTKSFMKITKAFFYDI